MPRQERAVNAGADRAGKDDGVGATLGENGHASIQLLYGIGASLCDCLSKALVSGGGVSLLLKLRDVASATPPHRTGSGLRS
jgi:hypothetical protein